MVPTLQWTLGRAIRTRRVPLVGVAVGLGLGFGQVAQAADPLEAAVLARMDAAIEQAIVEHRLPGAVLWVEHDGCAHHRALGRRALVPEPEAMTEDTIFDVASLTKVLATTPAVLRLCERGRVGLDEPVGRYLPEFRGQGKEGVTVRHLLTHTSGIRRRLSREPDWDDPKRALAEVCAAKLSDAPGTTFTYSDLNFILLGELVQRVSGQGLDAFCAAELFQPLGMVDTGFRPAASRRGRVAPTEVVGTHVLRGLVHDSKAQAMGGIAGHAGLFTTASDVARFARMVLHGGVLDGTRVLEPRSVQWMAQVQTAPAIPERRGLGWDIDSDFSHPRGERFPLGSFGHTGYSGVCLWIDPFSRTFWMLLSNRIHPETSADIRPLQRQLGTLAAEAVKGFNFDQVTGALPPRKARND